MKPSKSNRRKFLRNSSLGLLGAGILKHKISPDPAEVKMASLPKIKEYRRLGRTEALVSDIGSGEPYSESVFKAVLDSGVNFVETAESYSNGRNETLIGNVIRNYEREQLFIVTKASPTYKVYKSSDDIIRRAEASLKRLQTSYIDLYMIHQAQNLVTVRNGYFHRACDALKKQGKIRFVGLSCHGTYWWEEKESLEDILMTAIEDGRFDVLFCPYNFMGADMGERILQACRENDIGTMIMKSNPVILYDRLDQAMKEGRELSHSDQNNYELLKSQMDNARSFFEKHNMNDIRQIEEGAIQFILSNKNVHTICCRFRTFSDVEKYVKLSGTNLDDRTAQLLAEFKESQGFINCRIGCNACEKACPEKIPVSSIMRYNYYFHSQREEKKAMQSYSELGLMKPDTCYNCEGYCEQACPYNVSTRALMTMAHSSLSFNNHSHGTT
jgi:aryl-alcohol dehydrogenase-like predicted oxidoreductase